MLSRTLEFVRPIERASITLINEVQFELAAAANAKADWEDLITPTPLGADASVQVATIPFLFEDQTQSIEDVHLALAEGRSNAAITPHVHPMDDAQLLDVVEFEFPLGQRHNRGFPYKERLDLSAQLRLPIWIYSQPPAVLKAGVVSDQIPNPLGKLYDVLHNYSDDFARQVGAINLSRIVARPLSSTPVQTPERQ